MNILNNCTDVYFEFTIYLNSANVTSNNGNITICDYAINVLTTMWLVTNQELKITGINRAINTFHKQFSYGAYFLSKLTNYNIWYYPQDGGITLPVTTFSKELLIYNTDSTFNITGISLTANIYWV